MISLSWKRIYRLGSPPFLFHWIIRMLPLIQISTLLLFLLGLIGGFWMAPPDAVQGEGFRILYLHVPAAFLSLNIFVIMALCALIGLVWRVKVAFWIMEASAPIGASMTLLTLLTGVIWGKPMWGTWWVWDARLTSELILFFLYVGVIGLMNALSHQKIAHQAGAFAVIIGIVDIPIIHFSVQWWNTLHQGSTLKIVGTSTIHSSMMWPLLMLLCAFFLFYVWALFLRLRLLIVHYERETKWMLGN